MSNSVKVSEAEETGRVSSVAFPLDSDVVASAAVLLRFVRNAEPPVMNGLGPELRGGHD